MRKLQDLDQIPHVLGRGHIVDSGLPLALSPEARRAAFDAEAVVELLGALEGQLLERPVPALGREADDRQTRPRTSGGSSLGPWVSTFASRLPVAEQERAAMDGEGWASGCGDSGSPRSDATGAGSVSPLSVQAPAPSSVAAVMQATAPSLIRLFSSLAPAAGQMIAGTATANGRILR